MNLLIIDVGNTNTTIGIYEEKELKRWFRIRTDIATTSDELAIKIQNFSNMAEIDVSSFEAVVVSSVVPEFSEVIKRYSRTYLELEPLFIDHRSPSTIKIGYKVPQQVGADRIANCEAAYRDYGGNLIVVDFGTASTFDYITEDGIYKGGAIAPGFEMFTAGLFRRTAKLWRVELKRPATAVGRTTPNSIISGLMNGFRGMVEGILDEIKKEEGRDAGVIFTGGDAMSVVELLGLDGKVDETLTLRGCLYIYQNWSK